MKRCLTAVITSLILTPAGANAWECNNDGSSDKQASELQLIVNNESRQNGLEVRLRAPTGLARKVYLEPGETKKFRYNVANDQEPGDEDWIETENLGLNLKSIRPSGAINSAPFLKHGSTLLRHGITISNRSKKSINGVEDHESKLTVTQNWQARNANEPMLRCEVAFQSSGSNRWIYKYFIP